MRSSLSSCADIPFVSWHIKRKGVRAKRQMKGMLSAQRWKEKKNAISHLIKEIISSSQLISNLGRIKKNNRAKIGVISWWRKLFHKMWFHWWPQHSFSFHPLWAIIIKGKRQAHNVKMKWKRRCLEASMKRLIQSSLSAVSLFLWACESMSAHAMHAISKKEKADQPLD